jgi:hypothetical protein
MLEQKRAVSGLVEDSLFAPSALEALVGEGVNRRSERNGIAAVESERVLDCEGRTWASYSRT